MIKVLGKVMVDAEQWRIDEKEARLKIQEGNLAAAQANVERLSKGLAAAQAQARKFAQDVDQARREIAQMKAKK